MQYERCKENFCCKETCLNMSDPEYTFYIEHPHCHWFCSDCEAQALKSVQTDMEIEEKCREYMKVYDERLEKIETDTMVSNRPGGARTGAQNPGLDELKRGG